MRVIVAPEDASEREAERVADAVVGNSGKSSMPDPVRTLAADCPRNRVHRAPVTVAPTAGTPRSVDRVLASAGRPLPTPERHFMEGRFGADFTAVRIHTGGEAASSAAEIGAQAWTTGNDIVFAADRFRPGDAAGRRLLAHELAHVLQHDDRQIHRQVDPRHARGMAGEQAIGFGIYSIENGWAVISGPSGAGGHSVTAPGFDLVAYNVRTGELHIVDNKSLARAGRVSSATAITTNLVNNLQDLIHQVEAMSLEDLPMRQDVLRRLRQTRGAVLAGEHLPGRVRLVVINAGGRSTGVTERLRGLGVVFQDYADADGSRPGTRSPLPPGAEEPDLVAPSRAPPPRAAIPAAPPPAVSAAAIVERERLLAQLGGETRASAAFASRLQAYMRVGGILLEVVGAISVVGDAMAMRAEGTVLGDAQRDADRVRGQSDEALAFSEELSANTSLTGATIAVADAIAAQDTAALHSLSGSLGDYEQSVAPIGESFTDLGERLAAQAQALHRASGMYEELAGLPQGASTAGNAQALALSISLGHLSGTVGTAAEHYRQAGSTISYLASYNGRLASSANAEAWRLTLTAIGTALAERERRAAADAAERAAAPAETREALAVEGDVSVTSMTAEQLMAAQERRDAALSAAPAEDPAARARQRLAEIDAELAIHSVPEERLNELHEERDALLAQIR